MKRAVLVRHCYLHTVHYRRFHVARIANTIAFVLFTVIIVTVFITTNITAQLSKVFTRLRCHVIEHLHVYSLF